MANKDIDEPPGNVSPDQEFINKHKPPSKWSPPLEDIPPEVLKYTQELSDSLRNLPKSKQSGNNLTHREKIALRRLNRRNEIIIKPTDKGNGIAIMTKEQYKSEAERQLNNPLHYKHIEENITPEIAQNIKKLARKYVAKGLMKSEVADYIVPQETRPAKFYTLPKVHKGLSDIKGRPIMSANNHPTENLSEYVDTHLNKHVHKIKSYIKDTNHLIEILKPLHLPPNAKLVSLDVSSLYTNIPHNEGVEAVKSFMKTHKTEEESEMLGHLTEAVLTNNIFEFNNQFYLQISGTAMGSRMAPAYANIFMDNFEKTHLPNAPIQPIFWKRYLDDILIIFTCDDVEIDKFVTWINGIHPTIKFTLESDPKGIPFLDTFLSINEGHIRIRPYTKPTDTKQYIDPTSCHPPHIIKSIPYSQALRIKRLCTNEEDLIREICNLYGYFKRRNYNDDLLQQSMIRALNSTKPTVKRDTTPTTLIITYNPRNPNYARTLNKIWNKHEKYLTGITKPIVCYKRPKNLRDLLVKALFTEFGAEKTIKKIPLKNRPISTYTDSQLTKPITFIAARCEMDHRILMDEYPNIREALTALENNTNQQMNIHKNCGKINIIPIKGINHIRVGCTECNYSYGFKSNQKSHTINTELMVTCRSLHSGLFGKLYHKTWFCSRKNCQCCSHSIKSPTITAPNGIRYALKKFNCKQEKCVYIIQCTKCGINYVGKTVTQLNWRFNNHKSAARTNKAFKISQHFNGEDHSINEMAIGIIETSNNEYFLNIMEAYWINTLSTLSKGLNTKNEEMYNMDPNIAAITRHFSHSPLCSPYISNRITEECQLAP